MTVSWAKSNPSDWLPRWKEVVAHNMSLLSRIVEWNQSAGIRLFRISSDLVPFADHPEFGRHWRRLRRPTAGWWSQTVSLPRAAIAAALSSGARFTTHPPQFVSLGCPRAPVRRASIANLEYHAALLDDLGLPRSLECPINIHVSNGTRPSESIPLVRKSLPQLSPAVLSRLVFENEQTAHWTPSALVSAFPDIPVTLDYHHLHLNPDPLLSIEEIEARVTTMWKPFRPVCHWSQGRAHDRDPAHSEFVKSIPLTPFDMEVEAKGKDLAVLRLMHSTPQSVTHAKA